ncbi:MAG: hypothetical protein Q4G11_07695, partial [Gallicola sp.]|nr:hypothetical protein [Gallicola sp.]
MQFSNLALLFVLNIINQRQHEKYYITLACSYSIYCRAQFFDQIEGTVGFSINEYTVEKMPGFTERTDGMDGQTYVAVLGRKFIKSNPKFSYRLGAGVARSFLSLYPIIRLNQLEGFNLPGYDTLTVGEVANWDWQFIVPADFAYELFKQKDIFPPFFVLPGMRLRAGIENRFTFNRINTDNIIVRDYNEKEGYGYLIEDNQLRERVSNYYSDYIKRYNLSADAGAEFFFYYVKIGGVLGIRYKQYLLSPVESKIHQRSSFDGY